VLDHALCLLIRRTAVPQLKFDSAGRAESKVCAYVIARVYSASSLR
jgi:hypothetical protein